MKKRKILIPYPKSRFVLVKCPDCENEQIIFDRASTVVHCLMCGRVLARPTGGKAVFEGKVLKTFD
ncbi:MAG: 30S ribosomal protein S27e [Thermoprotei archaeon]|nr:MAG: 30S ribosomal protein S27e [Thermoprotei archaeon]